MLLESLVKATVELQGFRVARVTGDVAGLVAELVPDGRYAPRGGLDARLHWEPASPAARPALSPLENSRAFPGTSCGSRSGSPLWLPPSDLAAFGPGPSDR